MIHARALRPAGHLRVLVEQTVGYEGDLRHRPSIPLAYRMRGMEPTTSAADRLLEPAQTANRFPTVEVTQFGRRKRAV